jgi:tetratricopeptide (TPR) repeat protein
MPGVGKTAFSVKVANSVGREFADGCLFIDLHGYTGNVPPLGPGDALDRILRRLGLDAEEIPAQLDERSAKLRQLLADREVLLVLDNAMDSVQVKPLLPATGAAAVLITSRFRLVALDDAHHLRLPTLPRGEARAVFSSVVRADQAVTERQAGELIDACGGLPLALHIVAARCRDVSARLLAELGARMRDEWSRLDEMEDGERSVVAAFNVSFGALPARTRRVFALLGLYPGVDWSVYAAGALADLDVAAAARELERLANSHLVERDQQDRYRFHDLVRGYAARQALATVPETERSAGLQRLLTWAHETLAAADTLITPHRYRPELPTRWCQAVGPSLARYADAVAWVKAEQENLVEFCRYASERQTDPFSWQLAYQLRGFFFLVKNWDDWISTHQAALAGAMRAADHAAEAMTRNNLGLALMEKSRLDAANKQFLRARELFELSGDAHGMHNAIANHAAVLYYCGEFGRSLQANESAYEFYQRQGSSRNAAITLRSIALNEIALGDLTGAVGHLETARLMFVELGLPLDEVMAMNCLGEANLRRGDHPQAARWSLLAVERARSCGSSFEQARAYRNLGEVAAEAGKSQQAYEFWQRALSIYASLQAPQGSTVRSSLAELANRSAQRAIVDGGRGGELES